MKVKVLSRNPADYIRESKSDIHKLHRNLDPSLHPFEAPREYTRALNAVKLERVFAKPFVGSLDGHTDGVNCISRHPRSLSVLLSGSCDGEVGISLSDRSRARGENFLLGYTRKHSWNISFFFTKMKLQIFWVKTRGLIGWDQRGSHPMFL